MTRHDEQREIADFLTQALEDASKLDFLACVRAGGEEDGLRRCDAGLREHVAQFVDLRSGDGGSFGIVFDAADVLNSFSGNAKRDPAFDVFGILNGDEEILTVKEMMEMT